MYAHKILTYRKSVIFSNFVDQSNISWGTLKFRVILLTKTLNSYENSSYYRERVEFKVFEANEQLIILHYAGS